MTKQSLFTRVWEQGGVGEAAAVAGAWQEERSAAGSPIHRDIEA